VHSLAPLKLAGHPDLRWSDAPIPVREIEDIDAALLKAPYFRESDLVATLDLPAELAKTRIGKNDDLCIGITEWILLARPDHVGKLDELLRWAEDRGIGSTRCGDRLCILELDAPRSLLASLTGLRCEALATGRVARTRLADIRVTFAAIAEGTTWLIFDRSYAPHVRAWLDRAT
jgi:hypothetical protein